MSDPWLRRVTQSHLCSPLHATGRAGQRHFQLLPASLCWQGAQEKSRSPILGRAGKISHLPLWRQTHRARSCQLNVKRRGCSCHVLPVQASNSRICCWRVPCSSMWPRSHDPTLSPCSPRLQLSHHHPQRSSPSSPSLGPCRVCKHAMSHTASQLSLGALGQAGGAPRMQQSLEHCPTGSVPACCSSSEHGSPALPPGTVEERAAPQTEGS